MGKQSVLTMLMTVHNTQEQQFTGTTIIVVSVFKNNDPAAELVYRFLEWSIVAI